MAISASAGRPARQSDLVNVPRLVTSYFSDRPDPQVPSQRVSFGTSGHRGSSLARSFNEWHILAITQAICLYREQNGIQGPLFLGIDTHAVSEPAFASALEVLAANDIPVMIARGREYTPTPAVSHAILNYNKTKPAGRADGIVVTPSHNPPEDGGFKYNPPHGGPADTKSTAFIQERANELLKQRLEGVRRMPFERALRAANTREHDFVNEYVGDLSTVIDVGAIRDSKIELGVDPLGGAGGQLLGSHRRALRFESYGGKRRDRSDFPLYVARPGRTHPHGSIIAVRHASPDREERQVPDHRRLRYRP
jgi:phosphoglucomutase